MVTIACPWCEQELALADLDEAEASLRCDDCASVMELAPLTTAPVIAALPLAA